MRNLKKKFGSSYIRCVIRTAKSYATSICIYHRYKYGGDINTIINNMSESNNHNMPKKEFFRPIDNIAPGVDAKVYVQRLINDESAQLMIHIGDQRMVVTLNPSAFKEVLTNFSSVPVVVLIPEDIKDKGDVVAQFLKNFEV